PAPPGHDSTTGPAQPPAAAMTRGPARRLWMVLIFAGLYFAPVPWIIPAVVGAGLAVLTLRTLSGLTRRGLHPRAVPDDALVLGSDRRGAKVWVSERELAAHGLVVGASGAGKTTTLLRILSELIARGRPVVAIDLKGSPQLARSVAAAAADAGRPFRLWTPDGPAQWNPLGHGNATELKDKLIATERFTEPHYQRAAERYVQAVLQVLHELDGRPATLSKVVELMDPHRLRGALRNVPPPLRLRVQDYLAALTPDQLSAVRGLQTRLAILTESHTGGYLEPGAAGQGVDLRSALAGEEVVLFSLNSATYGKLAAQLGTLAVQDLVCAAGHRLAQGVAPIQGFVVIDEVSILGGDHVLALFARGREAGLGVLAATQELTDFERAAPGLRDQVLGNTAVKLAHRQEVPASAQMIAQLAGTERVWEETQQIGGSVLTGGPTGRGTRRQTEQFVVHPNVIKALGTGDAVLISKMRTQRAQTLRVYPAGAPARSARRPTDQDRSGIPQGPPGRELG
ncbi:MAG TPA: helicase HerA-like domain-containing protein, partial [Solirubrobacteraceae bacterium]|nr:helicase HerA-like domain-containing protein [Solirubrobacteraceae bacterium]